MIEFLRDRISRRRIVERIVSFSVVTFLVLSNTLLPSSTAKSKSLLERNTTVEYVEPPADCRALNVKISNPTNYLESLAAKFCETNIAGQGTLWLQSNATAAHIVRILPDVDVENLNPTAMVTWGPGYWFKIASNVQIPPGNKIIINASRFGSSDVERVAAVQINISLIAELLFLGDTPLPDMTKIEAIYRYGTEVPVIDVYVLFLECAKALEGGSKVATEAKCLTDLATSDMALESIEKLLGIIGTSIKATILRGLYLLGRIAIFGIPAISKLLVEASSRNQDVNITVHLPTGSSQLL